MSKTTVDFAKVTQMLDSGWIVVVFKNDIGSYSARAKHENQVMISRANKRMRQEMEDAGIPTETIDEVLESDKIETDDFTPEQAISRLAYKVRGEVLYNKPKGGE